jgi:hypothetical protein
MDKREGKKERSIDTDDTTRLQVCVNVILERGAGWGK